MARLKRPAKAPAWRSRSSELPQPADLSFTAQIPDNVSEADQLKADKIRQRRLPVFRAAAQALDRVETKFGLDLEERRALREALVGSVRDFIASGGAAEPDLPDKAPERWSSREGRKENPVAFIRRVYAQWLDRGLTRAHLLTIDRPLYTALAVWMHRHPDVEFPEMMPSAEQSARPWPESSGIAGEKGSRDK